MCGDEATSGSEEIKLFALLSYAVFLFQKFIFATNFDRKNFKKFTPLTHNG